MVSHKSRLSGFGTRPHMFSQIDDTIYYYNSISPRKYYEKTLQCIVIH